MNKSAGERALLPEVIGAGVQTAHTLIPQSDIRMLMNERPILIDARKIGDGGIGVYTQNLIADLVARDLPLAVLGDPAKFEAFRWGKQVRIISEQAKSYSADELLALPRRISFNEFSLFHAPHYLLPFRIPIPKIVTIHDLIHLTHPERFFYPSVAWGLIASALMRADGVTTVSAAALRDIERYFPQVIRRAKEIQVVPNRLADQFRVDSVFEAINDNRYLFVSTSQPKPHKGVLDLLKAFALAKDQLEVLVARGHAPQSALTTELVIGGYGSEGLRTVQDYQPYLSNRSDVRIVGSLTPVELMRYAAGARAVVVPSRAEGFGFPVIEAHAQGTPVIVRPVPALLELTGEYDLVAADLTHGALADTLIEALRSEKNSDAGVELRAGARGYSVDRFIDPILALYQRVLLNRVQR